MDAFNDSIFEEKYKGFLKVRSEWMKIVFKHAVYTDINTQGEACRPVALLTDNTVLAQAESLLLVWNRIKSSLAAIKASALSKSMLLGTAYRPCFMAASLPTAKRRPAPQGNFCGGMITSGDVITFAFRLFALLTCKGRSRVSAPHFFPAWRQAGRGF